MNGWIWTVAGVGFLLGMRHALDPDHVVAVSTIASEQKNIWRSSLVGAFWGLGHALALMIASAVVLALKLTISKPVAQWLESGVAVMLVILGISAIRRGLREWQIHAHRHVHDGHDHIHLHEHNKRAAHRAHMHRHILGFGIRPFSVGIFHGLAGSAGLAIVAVATTGSAATGLI
jgi:ABC-type nickel/cobalt efflux system permease component RcnA